MLSLISTPLERTLAGWWGSIDEACRKAFLAVLCINVLAFGFEMTNLTLHHDDVSQILIESTILGHYLGRFGHGWFHYALQNHYFMPFVQMAEGIVAMSAYAVIVSRFWGARRTTDLILMSAIICTFPYMAHVFQYNTAMAAHPTAYLLAALGVVLSVRARLVSTATAAALYFIAFSMYQAVAATAATIFVLWLLSRCLFAHEDEGTSARELLKASIAALASVAAGGIAYLVAVSMMNLEPDTIHSSEEAFQLRGVLDPATGMAEIVRGTYGFFRWPENYFPGYLKALQLAAVGGAVVYCLRVPTRMAGKMVAGTLLVLAILAPRTLQLLAPKGNFHLLTLTGYALVIAASVMIVLRAASTVARNGAVLLSTLIVAGYVLQCNWISTVNYLNTLAHFTTLSQILAQVRSLPDAAWDGRTIAVVGRYDMPSTYPYLPATGVATEYLDARHMAKMARLMRDQAVFVPADKSMPKILAYAATHSPWPASGSVGVVDGIGVVVFSRSAPAPSAAQ